MNLEQAKPVLTIGNRITVWIFIAGIVMTMVSFGNDLENEQLQDNVRQEETARRLDKQDIVLDKIADQLKDNRDILIKIETQQDNQ